MYSTIAISTIVYSSVVNSTILYSIIVYNTIVSSTKVYDAIVYCIIVYMTIAYRSAFFTLGLCQSLHAFYKAIALANTCFLCIFCHLLTYYRRQQILTKLKCTKSMFNTLSDKNNGLFLHFMSPSNDFC